MAYDTAEHEALGLIGSAEFAGYFHKMASDLLAKYAQDYRAEAVAALDALIALRLLPRSERAHFQHPTDPLGVRHVAEVLGEAAERLVG